MSVTIGGSTPQLTFADATVQNTAALPLTGGSVSADITVNGLTVGRGAGAVSTNTAVGASALAANTSGAYNTAVGYQAGYYVTTGSKNTILGGYSGNQGGLDIRTLNNYIVLSDGDGNPRGIFDNSGNLGLGVTPSAWGANYKGIQTSSGAFVSYSNTSQDIYYGAYDSSAGTWKYTVTGYGVNRLALTNGTFQFYVAPSGTAGNAITFTQAMTLDASGYLVVGDTVTSARFKAALTGASTASITTVSDFGATGILSLGNIGSNSQGVYLGTGDARTGINGGIAAGIGFLREASGWNSALAFYTNGTTDGTTTNRITERARIDSSGNLLWGISAQTNTPANGIVTQNATGASQQLIGHANGSGSGTYYNAFLYNSSIIGSITQSGTTGVLYNVTSDYRLKNNQEDLTGAKDFIMALKPKKWQWWDGSGEGVGFVAHEFMEIAKYSGQGEKDAVDADGKPVYQSIQPSSSEVMANLVSFIQELSAQVTALQAKVGA
jgi:hypothetical protein